MNSLNLITKSALMSPSRVVEPLWWVGHIPFVMWLIENTKPQTLVELGTHTGNSYFSMCQSVKENALPTRCYAVDTWQGDLHQGPYEDDVYHSVKQYNDSHYSEFSDLLRMTFDEALPKFSEGTVDLLHIDGLHTYEAARHDFETWLPKLSDRAIVLFHDTSVRRLDFGVWRLWEELSVKYPNIHFDYSQGLGVLFVGMKQPLVINDLLNSWVAQDGLILVHQIFARLGHIVEFEHKTTNVINQAQSEIDSINQALAKSDGQIKILNQQKNELHNEIEMLRFSKSWRVTKPLRDVSRWLQRLTHLIRIYQNYRQIYPGLTGFRRLTQRSIDAIRRGGFKGLLNNAFLYERMANRVPLSAEAVAQQCNAQSIDILRTYLNKNPSLKSTIIFDHNGGGGSNIYSNNFIKVIQADGGVVLRVYCFEAVWIVQWSGAGEVSNYYTSAIEELFEVLSASHSASIAINSLYGYLDIEVAVTNIIGLARSLNATLDFKTHDFYALCPSPHLSDFQGKYCGVPQDIEVCKSCLRKNLDWYHGWYPRENRPIDISKWRKPFAKLLEAATTVTFFDQSSVEIVRKIFILDESKIKVTPHNINDFKCDKQIDLKGQLHIGVLGTLSEMKGGKIVSALYEHIEKCSLKIPITVIGRSLINTPQGINVHGSYTPNDLPTIIENYGVNVILMPSIVPETFSYTISEAMEMGLPIVAFNIGAQGTRLSQYEMGEVIPLGSSPDVILAAIQSTLKAAQELAK